MAFLGGILSNEHADLVNGAWILDSTSSRWVDPTNGLLLGNFLKYGYGTDWLVKKFPGVRTTCCISGKWIWGANNNFGYPFLAFSSGSKRIVSADMHYGNGDNVVQLTKYNPGTGLYTLLGTSAPLAHTNFRFEMMIENHGASARVRMWQRPFDRYHLVYGGPHTLVLDGTFDTRVEGYEIDGMWVGVPWGNWIEMNCFFACDGPTHWYEVFGKNITGAGDVNTMAAGTYADIKEKNPDTTNYVEATEDGQRILCTTDSLPSKVLRVEGWQISEVAVAGTSGPTGSRLGFKTGGVEDWDDITHALGPGWENHSRLPSPINPATGENYTRAEMNAVQLGTKAVVE